MSNATVDRQTYIGRRFAISLSMTFTVFIDQFQVDIIFCGDSIVLLTINNTQYLLYPIISLLISRTNSNFHRKFNALCLRKKADLLGYLQTSTTVYPLYKIRQHAVNFRFVFFFCRSDKGEKSHKNLGRKML